MTTLQDPRLKTIEEVYRNYNWVPFAEAFMKVKTPSGSIVPFRANYMQRRFARDRVEGKNRICRLKMRRGGSTLGEILAALTYMLNIPYFNVVVTSNHRPSALRIVREIVKPILENLDPLMVASVEKIDLVERELRITHHGNRGQSTMFIGSLLDDSFGLGYDIHYAIHTEYAECPRNGPEIVANINQAIPFTGFITFESTAHGAGGEFHRTYSMAKSGRGVFAPQFFPWWTREDAAIPGGVVSIPAEIRDDFILNEHERYLRNEFGLRLDQFRFYRYRQMMDGDLVRQYYPENDTEAFTTSERIQLPPEILAGMYNEARPTLETVPSHLTMRLASLHWQPLLSEEANGMRIWHLPEPGRLYSIGVDSGKGEKSSNLTVMQVLNLSTGEQEAIIRGTYRPDETAQMTAELGYLYNTAFVVPEANGIGAGVCDILENRLRYPALFRLEVPPGGKEKSAGFNMDHNRKADLFGKLGAALAAYQIRFNDRTTISQALSYRVDNKGRINAMEGEFDDCVTSFMLAMLPYTDGVGMPGRGARPKAIIYGEG